MLAPRANGYIVSTQFGFLKELPPEQPSRRNIKLRNEANKSFIISKSFPLLGHLVERSAISVVTIEGRPRETPVPHLHFRASTNGSRSHSRAQGPSKREIPYLAAVNKATLFAILRATPAFSGRPANHGWFVA